MGAVSGLYLIYDILQMAVTDTAERQIADEGKELVNGDTVATVIDVDVDDVDKWIEQEAPRRNERRVN